MDDVIYSFDMQLQWNCVILAAGIDGSKRSILIEDAANDSAANDNAVFDLWDMKFIWNAMLRVDSRNNHVYFLNKGKIVQNKLAGKVF